MASSDAYNLLMASDVLREIFGSESEEETVQEQAVVAEELADEAEKPEPVRFEAERNVLEVYDTPLQRRGEKTFYVSSTLLEAERRAFNPETYAEVEEQKQAARDPGEVRIPPSLVLRWRRTDDGQMESNTRLVEWDDGSFTLHIGSEVLHGKPHVMGGDVHYVFVQHPGTRIVEYEMPINHRLPLYPASASFDQLRKMRTSTPALKKAREARVRLHYDLRHEGQQRRDIERYEMDVVRGDVKREAEERKLSARTARAGLAEFLEQGAAPDYDERAATSADEEELDAAQAAMEARRQRQRQRQRRPGDDGEAVGSKRAATADDLSAEVRLPSAHKGRRVVVDDEEA